MSNPVTEVTEFYHQLALLIRADMPLPECLIQVGRQSSRRAFRDAVASIGKRAGDGEPLAELLAAYPHYFSPFHVQLVRLGEQSGTLPEMLRTVSRFCRFQQLMGAGLRDAIAYPLLVAHVAAIAFLIVCLFMTPTISSFLSDLPVIDDGGWISEAETGFAPLPWFSGQVLSLAEAVGRHREIAISAYILFVLYSIWLFLPLQASHRSILRLIERLPGSWKIAHSATSARICTMWAAFIEREVPAPAALDLVAQLAEHPRTSRALSRAADRVRAGEDVADALDPETAVDPLITLVFRHAPEHQLAEELSRLATLYDQRVALTSRAVARAWTFWAFLICSFLVGGVAIAVFLPFLRILTSLQGLFYF